MGHHGLVAFALGRFQPQRQSRDIGLRRVPAREGLAVVLRKGFQLCPQRVMRLLGTRQGCPRHAQAGKVIANARRRVPPRGCAQLANDSRNLRAVPDDTESISMQKLEMREARRQIGKQPVHAEPISMEVGVVQQNHGARRKLGPPGLIVMLNYFKRVVSVDVQQIDRAIIKLRNGAVELRADQFRKRAVVLLVESAHILKDFVAIGSGVRITTPMVDGIAARGEFAAQDCLTKCGI